ncbi:MAG TPA: integrase core domain-containing protein [Saprospiraceae bacterium]|nr:integrase core domain-containing protein [Saprospiraceae bacterium]
MQEYKLRKEAVRRYLAKEKISTIAKVLKRSRKWVYLWIERYKSDLVNVEWYKDHSKAPINKPTKVVSEIEERIILVREYLENQMYAQIGAISIQYEFERRGWPIPEVWTIDRTIVRNGLTKPPVPARIKKVYPELFIHTHQMDLVGPRYIKGDGSLYSVNLIDITSHTCYVKAVRNKSSKQILGAIVEFWQTYGMPDALQMDNELAFRGSNRYPRSFGSVIRFALSQGVAPVFIPVREPWRNGIIEKFNDNYDKRFYRKHKFINLEAVSIEEKKFIAFHNGNHTYSAHGKITPDKIRARDLPAHYYTGNIHLEKSIPLLKGCIYYIRYIRSDSKLYLPNESFLLDIKLIYSYVIAQINIDCQSLVIWQNHEIRQVIAYEMPKDW